MKRSTERILTTHTGSLPRPGNLMQMLIAKEQGKLMNAGELDSTVRNAVAEVVKHQVAIGIDIISDGEMSKIGLANCRCQHRRISQTFTAKRGGAQLCLQWHLA